MVSRCMQAYHRRRVSQCAIAAAYNRLLTYDCDVCATQPRLSLLLLFTIQNACLPCRRAVCAVGVATLNANSVKKLRINAKNEPSKCSGLAISRRRQIYALIGVELRTQRLEKDIFVRTHLHTTRIVVSIYKVDLFVRQNICFEWIVFV